MPGRGLDPSCPSARLQRCVPFGRQHDQRRDVVGLGWRTTCGVLFVGANFFDLKVVIAEGPGIHWLEKYQVAHELRLDPSLCKLKFDLASAAEHRADHDLHIVPQPGYQLQQFGFADAAELTACDA